MIDLVYGKKRDRSGSAERLWLKKIQSLVLEEIDEAANIDVSVLVIDDDEMKKLNKDYRGLAKTTDVLSFLYAKEPPEKKPTGEIFISLPQAQRQAARYGVTLKAEMGRLIVHGLLHLQGYDHVKKDDRKVMRALEKNIEALAKKETLWKD